MWREVALRKLLTIVDVPILDGLLSEDKAHRKSNRFNVVITNVINNRMRPATSAGGNEDPWVKSALEVLEGLPLGLSVLDKELQGPVTRSTKRQLFRAICKHYSQGSEPLLPERFIDLYLAILNLILQEKDDLAVQALQLLMILLPWQTIEEVDRLFRFMVVVANDSSCFLEEQVSTVVQFPSQFSHILFSNFFFFKT